MKMKHIGSLPQDVLSVTFTNASAVMLWQPEVYGPLAERSRALYDSLASVPDQETRQHARNQALAAPAIGFLVDTTLDTLERPKVARQLPIDAYRRALWAMEIAENYADLAAETRTFIDFYSQNSHLRDVTASNATVLRAISDNGYLTRYSVAPFRETCCVAGGAVRAARKWISGKRSPEIWQEFDLDQAIATEIVMHSSGLQIVASLEGGNANRNISYLGRPYAGTGHFESSVANNAPVVRFAPRTLRHLGSIMQRQSPQRGCPVRKMASGEPRTTELAAAWARIVRAIVPPEARVQAAPNARSTKKGAHEYF